MDRCIKKLLICRPATDSMIPAGTVSHTLTSSATAAVAEARTDAAVRTAARY